MKLNVSIAGGPSRHLYCKCRDLPTVGETFYVVDKEHKTRTMVRLTAVKTHIGGGDIYFVEPV